ncbi:hypothetical protein Ocin01_02840 [Orchesella cincta]|uniref:Uncharacterized protein n=1 Tax=Orchesella cincta TaxID=48709 RepID=A0A1D2NF13_ORCCI|nr:hypothetical protein Ocin01_02840 [Orchesella cincta]
MQAVQFRISILLILSNSIFGTSSVKVAIKSQHAGLCIRVRDMKKVELDECYWKNDGPTVKNLEAEQIFDIHPSDVPSEEGQDEEGVEKVSSFLIRLSSQKKNTCLAAISSTVTLEKCQLLRSRFRISGMILRDTSTSCRNSTFNDFRYKFQPSPSSCLDVSSSNGPGKNYLIGSSKCALAKTEMKNDPQLWQLCTQNGNCSLSLSDLAWNSFVKIDTQGEMDKVNCTEPDTTTRRPTEIPIIDGDFLSNHSTGSTTGDAVIADSGTESIRGLSKFTIVNFAFCSIITLLFFTFLLV